MPRYTSKQVQCVDCQSWFECRRNTVRCPSCSYRRELARAREYSHTHYRHRNRPASPRQIPSGQYVLVESPIKMPDVGLKLLDSRDIYRMMREDTIPIGAVIEHETGQCYMIACEPGQKNLTIQDV